MYFAKTAAIQKFQKERKVLVKQPTLDLVCICITHGLRALQRQLV